MTWAEAYAFCIWDGGFLPSEAEWEYAAAGGNEQREFPWGSTDPATESQYAIYGYWTGKPPSFGACYCPSAGPCTGVMNTNDAGPSVLCASGPMGYCNLAFCVEGCCTTGGGGECTGCCMDKDCSEFGLDQCPLDRCNLLPGCAGWICSGPLFHGRAPPPLPSTFCDIIGIHEGFAPCCAGLTARCGALIAGACVHEAGVAGGLPVCIECGDGTCEAPFENFCSCPEDCPP